MQKKSNSLMYSVAVFAFLYSGTVIHSPFYSSGNAVVNYVVTSVITLLYTAFAAWIFSGRDSMKAKLQAKFFAVAISMFAVVLMASASAEYIKTLGTFAEYYASPLVAVFSAAAVIFCAVYGGSRGRSCVMGAAMLTFWLFVLWTGAGFFAFFTTKNIVPLTAPFEEISESELSYVIKSAAYICPDVTLLAAVLCDNESESVRKNMPTAMKRGAVMFVLLSGINVFRNLLLFGNEFASRIQNPDLAAIRLIPMVDLPEISVIVNTFACVIKISVYACLVCYVLRDAFAHCYNTVKTTSAVFFTGVALSVAFVVLKEKAELLNGFAVFCLTFCVLLCYVFFSLPIKRQNNRK